MDHGYDWELCLERHKTVDRRLDMEAENKDKLATELKDYKAIINGKFDKLFYFFLATLLTSIGGTIGIIVMLVKSGVSP